MLRKLIMMVMVACMVFSFTMMANAQQKTPATGKLESSPEAAHLREDIKALQQQVAALQEQLRPYQAQIKPIQEKILKVEMEIQPQLKALKEQLRNIQVQQRPIKEQQSKLFRMIYKDRELLRHLERHDHLPNNNGHLPNNGHLK